jgi:eukaryotic-like serine/threonine-protein kinase
MSESRQREVTGGSTGSRAAAPDPLIGRVINERFKVVSVIARGGMGKVYRAEQAPLGRICALKVLSPKYEGDRDPEFNRRFFLEAATAAKLTHPNTVTVFDYGQSDDDIYYIAMEYIEGKTLHRVLREEGPFNEARTAHIARQICRSLREAHALGVVHRDLKPGNVLLVDREDERDHVKVLDFGLVKDTESGEDLTQQGLFMGSPKYMAPEQITGGGVSARTDIYALGVMMYEMLSGKVPFDKGASVGTLMSHVHDRLPPMQVHHPELVLTPHMEAIVYRCLEKDPGQRFSSMNELLAALKRLEAGAGMRETGESLPAITGGYRSSQPAIAMTGEYLAVSSPSSAPPPSSAITYSGPIATDTSLKPPSPPVFVAPSITDSMGPRPTPPLERPSLSDVGRSPARRLGPWAIMVAVGVAAAAVVLSKPGPVPTPLGTTPAEPGAAAQPQSPEPRAVPASAAVDARKLQVESLPPGASVREGNRELCAETPCEIVWRGPAAAATSEHELIFELKGYKPATVVVSSAEEKLRAKMEAAPGSFGGNSRKTKPNEYKSDPYKHNPY